jgi:hypothetical protein
MKYIVLFSGGANSAYTAWMVNQKHHADTILLHTPTYSEHPDADRFRKQFADYLNLPITVQADGRNIWQLINDEHCLPSERIPFCSRILKLEQSQIFYKNMADDFIVYYGYDGTEWRRAQRSSARLEHQGIKSEYPLLMTSITSNAIKDFIRNNLRICLPEPYLYLKHNNCIPCFKGGKQHFYQVWKYYPDYFLKAIKAEHDIGYTVFPDISLTKLAEQWQSQIPLFTGEEDLRPCMCAI